MFREFVVRITTGDKTRDVVVIAINSSMAQVQAFEKYGCDVALVMRDLTGCEACQS